jgi:hypothetical protein
MHPREVCALLGLPQSNLGTKRLRRLVAAKIKKAAGRLDAYDPRIGPGVPPRYSEVSLRRIFPELFDPRDPLAEELRERLGAMTARIDELEDMLDRQAHACKGRDDAIAKAIREMKRKP